MCGVFGVVDLERQADGVAWTAGELAAVTAARDILQHRGPDGAGLWHRPGVVLAHRRLAILDLSPTGHQPMEDGRGGALTFNGEIYNYLELRRELLAGLSMRSSGDTEVLAALLARLGLAPTCAALRGMYAFAWWDAGSRALHLARDPVGKKPLYVWQAGPRLAFASGLQALVTWLRSQGIALSVDPVAIEHHLASGYIAAPRTAFREVTKLAAGETATFDRAGLHLHAARPLPIPPRGRRLDLAGIDALDGLLQTAVQRRLRSDVPVATFLSGGLDSSLITALAARAQPGITAFTAHTPGHNIEELAVARRVAQAAGVRHELLELRAGDIDLLDTLVEHHGEPFGDTSALPTYLIAQLAGRTHRVVLTGDGGDEVQGGYSGARLFALRHVIHDVLPLPTADRLPKRLGDRVADEGVGLHRRHRDVQFKLMRLLAAGIDAASAQRDDLQRLHGLFDASLHAELATSGWRAQWRQRWQQLSGMTELDRALAMDFTVYLPEDLCVKVDVASMAHAVETRAPLLDLDFTDACWQVRPFDRVRPWQSKRIVRALLARHLPADCVLGPKLGFSIPVDRWLGTAAVKAELEAALLAGLPGMPWFDGGAAVRELRRRDQLGEATGTLRWRLLFLARWVRRFCDR
ncbi:MAG: asparagine synthase (glutamine-hydrolyzing) [Myxococcales bacterium]|nr:asparagine synthase (glutamine-hydrolyzing) [Myxococcales bacterium]